MINKKQRNKASKSESIKQRAINLKMQKAIDKLVHSNESGGEDAKIHYALNT